MARGRRGLTAAQLSQLPRTDPRRLEIVARSPSGRAKRYADRITGEQYTQRDLQTLRSGGFKPEHAAAIRKSGLHNQIRITQSRAVERGVDVGVTGRRIRALATDYARKEGKPITAAFGSVEFWKAVRQLERGKSNAPDSAIARALETLGRRPPGAPYKVGQSPPVKRKK